MPMSWLSDISGHIKALREVSDYQAEEVFECVNILHENGLSRGSKKKRSRSQNCTWDRRVILDSLQQSSTEEEEECLMESVSQTR